MRVKGLAEAGICLMSISLLEMSVLAVSEEVPVPAKSLKLVLIVPKLLLRLLSCDKRVFSPVKKVVVEPLVVALPLSTSSTKRAVAQPMLPMDGPKVDTFMKPS